MYNTNPKTHYSTKEAADALGYSYDYVSKLCRTGYLKAERSGNAWLIAADDLEAFKRVHASNMEEYRLQAARRAKRAKAAPRFFAPVCRTVFAAAFAAVIFLGAGAAYGKADIALPPASSAHASETASAYEAGRTTLLAVHGVFSELLLHTGEGVLAVLNSIFGANVAYAPSDVHSSATASTVIESHPVQNYITNLVTNNPVSYVYSGSGVSIEYVQRAIDNVRRDLARQPRSSSSSGADVSTASIEDLADVGAMTKSIGDLLYWNGSTWSNIATSSLGLGGGIAAVSAGGTGTSTAPAYGQLLMGDGAGGYALVATSSLGINAGAAAAGGASGQVQFNDAGSLNGNAQFTFDQTAHRLVISYASSTAFSSTYASSTNFFAGTATIGTLSGILKATGGLVSVAAQGVDYESPLSFVYPIVRSVNSISLAFGTTTQNFWSAYNNFSSFFATNASSTNATTTSLGINSETFTDLTGAGLQNIAGALSINATGDWTGTFDGQEGTYYLSRANHTGTQLAATISDFSSAVNAYIHGSTTIPKTYTANTFTAANVFSGGVTIGALNGPLQANAGVVSATTSVGVLYGGTGLASAPAYGQVLVGNSSGGYTLTATSSLGLAAGGVTSIGPAGALQSGPAITLATSSTAFNGLTASTTITASGNTITFANTLAGLLGVQGGGTGSSTPLGGILTGNGSGAITAASVSAPLTFTSNTLAITQSGTGANGYLSSTDFNTFNNKISSTSLSGASVISYNSSTGVITTTGGTFGAGNYVFPGSVTAPYASSTAFSSGYASSTNAFFGNLSIGSLSGVLKATAGVVSAAVAGTDYESPLSFVYPIVRSVNSISLAFGTTTQNFWSAYNNFGSLFATNASSTNATTTSLGINSETFTDLTGAGLQNIAGALSINATGDWTGTFDGQEGTYYLSRANHTGTQAASTITGGTFGAGSFVFPGSVTAPYASSTAFSSSYASTTSLFVGNETVNGRTTYSGAPVYDLASGALASQLILPLDSASQSVAASKTFSGIRFSRTDGSDITFTGGSSSVAAGIYSSVTAGAGSDSGSNVYGAVLHATNAGAGTTRGLHAGGYGATGATGPVNAVAGEIVPVATNSTASAFFASLNSSGVNDIAVGFDLESSGDRYVVGYGNVVNPVPIGSAYYRAWMSDTSSANSRAFQVLNNAGNEIAYWNRNGGIYTSSTLSVGTTTPYARSTVWGGASDTTLFEVVNSASTTALSVSATGFGTTTLRGLTVNGSATSTSNVGFNITTGCYAVNGTCLSTGGGVSSVSNADGSLTISPTTGAVVASLNLANANTWIGLQQFNRASTTLLSSYDGLYVGRTATTTIRGDGTASILPYASSTSITTSGTTYLAGGASALVGVGTTTPGAKLVISTSGGENLYLDNPSGQFSTMRWMNNGAIKASTYWDNTNTKLENNITSTGAFTWVANGSEWARLTSSGNLGLGTTTPLTPLHVNGSNAGVRVSDYAANANSWVELKMASSGGLAELMSTQAPLRLGTLNSGTYVRFDTVAAERMRIDASGTVGIGTTTPRAGQLSIASTTGSQLSLSDGSTTASPFNFRAINNTLYISTSSPTTFATTSSSIFSLNSATGSTTLLKLDITGTATSSFGGGINIASGCFSINGTCVGGSSFSNTLASGGTATTTFYSGGVVFSDGTKLTQSAAAANFFWDETNKRLGIGTSSPWAMLSINPNALGSGIPEFVIGSSSATRLIVTGAGNIGIGTTSPTRKLTVYSAANPRISIDSDADGNPGFELYEGNTRKWLLFNSTDDSFRIRDGGSSDFFTITSTGNVGIGIAGSAQTLHVASAGTREGLPSTALFSDTTDTTEGMFFGYSSTGNYGIIAASRLGTAWHNIALAPSGGNIGVGTTTPAVKLDVYGGGGTGGLSVSGTVAGLITANAFYVDNNGGDSRLISVGANSATKGSFSFVNSGLSATGFSTAMTISSTGNVGIGTTTPGTKLNIAGGGISIEGDSSGTFSTASNGLHLAFNTTTNTSRIMSLQNGIAWRAMQLDAATLAINTQSGGSVGIGTSTPNANLVVQTVGSVGNVALGTWAGSANYGAIYLNSSFANSSNYNLLSAQSGVDLSLYLNRPSSGAIKFREANSSTDQLTLNSGGSSIFPDGNLSVCTGGACPTGTPAGNGNLIVETAVGVGSSTPWAGLSIVSGKALVVAENTLATSTSMTVDWRNGNQQLVRTGTSGTTISFSGFIEGQKLVLTVCNPNATAGAITWGTQILWSGGTAPTQTTTANKCDVWSFLATNATSTLKIFGAQSANF